MDKKAKARDLGNNNANGHSDESGMYPYGNLKQLQSKLDEDDQKDFKLDAGTNNLIMNDYEQRHQNAMSTKIAKSKSHFLGNEKSNTAGDQIDSGSKEYALD